MSRPLFTSPVTVTIKPLPLTPFTGTINPLPDPPKFVLLAVSHSPSL